jgi:RimJ/RimL family protein N-acetyltransferase
MVNLGSLAEASHAFTTKDGKGRLLLRDIEFHEGDQYISIRQDKANNKFAPYKPMVDPEAKLKDHQDLAVPVLTNHRAASKMFRLAVISKAENPFKHKELMVNGGTLVGVVDFALNSWDQSAHIGVLIHHPFTPQQYAKEALFAVLDYAFLGDLKLAWNGVLGRLGLEKVVLEGEKADLGISPSSYMRTTINIIPILRAEFSFSLDIKLIPLTREALFKQATAASLLDALFY